MSGREKGEGHSPLYGFSALSSVTRGQLSVPTLQKYKPALRVAVLNSTHHAPLHLNLLYCTPADSDNVRGSWLHGLSPLLSLPGTPRRPRIGQAGGPSGAAGACAVLWGAEGVTSRAPPGGGGGEWPNCCGPATGAEMHECGGQFAAPYTFAAPCTSSAPAVHH